MNKLLIAGITGILASGLAIAASAQTHSAQDEINTAHAHALMAQSANTIAMTHTHLHHVINCLVGPSGTGFDAAAGEPCKGQGDGALPDSTNDRAIHARLERALRIARAGLKANDLAAAHDDAGKVAAALATTASPITAKTSSGASW